MSLLKILQSKRHHQKACETLFIWHQVTSSDLSRCWSPAHSLCTRHIALRDSSNIPGMQPLRIFVLAVPLALNALPSDFTPFLSSILYSHGTFSMQPSLYTLFQIMYSLHSLSSYTALFALQNIYHLHTYCTTYSWTMFAAVSPRRN